MRFSPAMHAHAAGSLRNIAEEFCQGRLIALGGGGYNRGNLAVTWSGVVESLF
jgi:acetoin utilization protein AcuC